MAGIGFLPKAATVPALDAPPPATSSSRGIHARVALGIALVNVLKDGCALLLVEPGGIGPGQTAVQDVLDGTPTDDPNPLGPLPAALQIRHRHLDARLEQLIDLPGRRFYAHSARSGRVED